MGSNLFRTHSSWKSINKVEFSIFSFPSNFCERIESTMANPFLYYAPTFDYSSEERGIPWQGPWFPSSEMFLPETEFFPVIEQPLEYYDDLPQVFSVPSVDAYAMGQPSEPYVGYLHNSKYIINSKPFIYLIGESSTGPAMLDDSPTYDCFDYGSIDPVRNLLYLTVYHRTKA